MEKELSKKYYYNPSDFDLLGRRKSDGMTFRDVIKEFEYDFHETYSTEYALNLYASFGESGHSTKSEQDDS